MRLGQFRFAPLRPALESILNFFTPMKRILLTFCLLPLLGAFAGAVVPDTEEVIAKARDYLGGDQALDRIESIEYVGTYESNDGASGDLSIIFKKPMLQRVEVNRGDFSEVSVLNEIDGWRKVVDANDEKRWSIHFLEPPRIRELQANTWENLYFFRNIEGRRGRIENEGLVELDGQEAVKLIFRHPREIAFIRYFDAETGRLLMTETHDGAEIREYGEVIVDGILFPERIVMKRPDDLVNEIRFTEIKINEKVDEDLFTVPNMRP